MDDTLLREVSLWVFGDDYPEGEILLVEQAVQKAEELLVIATGDVEVATVARPVVKDLAIKLLNRRGAEGLKSDKSGEFSRTLPTDKEILDDYKSLLSNLYPNLYYSTIEVVDWNSTDLKKSTTPL